MARSTCVWLAVFVVALGLSCARPDARQHPAPPAANVLSPPSSPATDIAKLLSAGSNYQDVASSNVKTVPKQKSVTPEKEVSSQEASAPVSPASSDENQIPSSKDYEKSSQLVAVRPVNERFPHAVLFSQTCGGSIISPTWVLTAGHCTLFGSGRNVLAGTADVGDDRGVSVRVKRLVIHPRFSVGPYWLDPDAFNISQVPARFDFLLAELERPLPIDGKTIAAVPLDDGPALPPHLDVGYAGFGAAVHGGVMRDEMHGMALTTLPHEECARRLDQFDKQDMLCARGRPPRFDSACNGDSGSGLVGGGRLVGVASWVEQDSRRCFPGAVVVFARVAAARAWIRDVTGV